ncbi:MAG: erg24, C-14 sterol reductase [Thelocarpon impressellum]|nr:MAG: erg24, C-14 sterol reductase [Thelocarpon impressellum]
MTLGLPLVVYLLSFVCNDVAGCPAPSTLHPSTLDLQSLKREVGWPGVTGLASFSTTAWVLGYYALLLVLQGVLPGQDGQGVELASGGKLTYRLNGFNSAMFVLVLALAGTIAQGADFVLWTFIWDNYIQIVTANTMIAFALASFVYVRSFSVKAANGDKRELAAGGFSGNLIYDWFIGRELNPRVTLPFIGAVDIKEFCELRPGMLGWILLNLAFVAHQYKKHGHVTDSILLVTAFQAVYTLDALWMEPSVLTTMDITTDGFGFMLAFGDLVWLPFTYSVQTRYLAYYPLSLGILGTLGVLAVGASGFYVFRSSNNEKNRFRTDPADPRVAHLQYMETKSGSKLLISGWWGVARHINYLGDWIMSWAWCLPTGIAGFLVQQKGDAGVGGGQSAGTGAAGGQAAGTELVQGEARGWGMLITYFYMLYFAILLIHRETRDEQKCAKKYGDDWQAYKRKVPSRILPGVY